MTVGELRKLLAELDSDVLVVTPGIDHSYVPASASLGKAEIQRGPGGRVKYIWEYYDEPNRSRKDTSVNDVVVIS